MLQLLGEILTYYLYHIPNSTAFILQMKKLRKKGLIINLYMIT